MNSVIFVFCLFVTQMTLFMLDFRLFFNVPFEFGHENFGGCRYISDVLSHFFIEFPTYLKLLFLMVAWEACKGVVALDILSSTHHILRLTGACVLVRLADC